jgi:hypothetical protein
MQTTGDEHQVYQHGESRDGAAQMGRKHFLD